MKFVLISITYLKTCHTFFVVISVILSKNVLKAKNTNYNIMPFPSICYTTFFKRHIFLLSLFKYM